MHVLIIDDHPLYREGLKAVLAGLDPELVSTAVGSVEEALGTAATPSPYDLILLDLTLGGVSGLDALRLVKASFEHSIVVINSGADLRAEEILKTIDLGAAGYIHKTTDNVLTLQALRVVLAHGVYVPSEVLRSQAAPQPAVPVTQRPNFSPKQQLVLDRLLQGKSNKAIARELDIAEGTVKAHLWAVYQMLGVASRTQALCRMNELGLLGAMSAN